jgi:hypothetical protein
LDSGKVVTDKNQRIRSKTTNEEKNLEAKVSQVDKTLGTEVQRMKRQREGEEKGPQHQQWAKKKRVGELIWHTSFCLLIAFVSIVLISPSFNFNIFCNQEEVRGFQCKIRDSTYQATYQQNQVSQGVGV